MKTIKNIMLSVALLLSAGLAKASEGVDIFSVMSHEDLEKVSMAKVAEVTTSTAENMLKAGETLTDLMPKRVASKYFLDMWNSLSFMSLKQGVEYAKQICGDSEQQAIENAAQCLDISLEEAADIYGKNAVVPTWAYTVLANKAKMNKLVAIATIAVATGVYIAYKCDLHKKAYNGLVALKNKVFGKNETK